MIVCPNCNHQNPDAAVQCEACYTPLPSMTTCPSCGASVQTDASFCGQCGFNLQAAAQGGTSGIPATISPDFDLPDLPQPEPLVLPDPLVAAPVAEAASSAAPEPPAASAAPEPLATSAASTSAASTSMPPSPAVAASPPVSPSPYKTQLQTQSARLLHVQTNTPIELPSTLAVIHLGKPNDRVPPDVDVSGFPNSEIVSRIHADIRVEGDTYYIEDVGSSNGTYINNAPLPAGNRHRLRPGDRIALGKGDKVTFLFQIS